MRLTVREFSLFLVVLGCVTTAAAGCKAAESGGMGSEAVRWEPALALPPVHAVAVYPFAFRWSEPAYRSFELSQRLLGVAERELGHKALLFAPPDFRVDRPLEKNAWVATNLVSVLAATDVRPEHAVVLRAWAERRTASQLWEQIEAPQNGVAHAELVYIGHVEMQHPSTHRVLFELVGEIKVDVFARAETEVDPAPELTRLMEALSAEALRRIRGQVHGKEASRVTPVEQVLFNPGNASLEEELALKDPLEADVLRMDRIRFANPSLPDRDAARLLRLPEGLYVTKATDDGQFKPGDLILSVDGTPARPQTLQRALFTDQPVRMTVRRASGAQEELQLP